MGTSAKRPHNGSPARDDPRPDAVASLIRRLVREASEEGEAPAASDDDVIVDIHRDGLRCIIVRAETAENGTPRLSPREGEIARMVALGYPNKTIAAVLDISTWTVGSHLRRIFAKLQVPSRAAMVARLSAEGQILHPRREP